MSTSRPPSLRRRLPLHHGRGQRVLLLPVRVATRGAEGTSRTRASEKRRRAERPGLRRRRRRGASPRAPTMRGAGPRVSRRPTFRRDLAGYPPSPHPPLAGRRRSPPRARDDVPELVRHAPPPPLSPRPRPRPRPRVPRPRRPRTFSAPRLRSSPTTAGARPARRRDAPRRGR